GGRNRLRAHGRRPPGARLADRLRRETVEGPRLGQRGNRPCPRSRKRRGDEDEQLVDQVGREEGGGQGRPAFEEERLHSLVGEHRQLVVQRARAELELRARRQRATAEGE